MPAVEMHVTIITERINYKIPFFVTGPSGKVYL
jgi:hypothetical protein